jgi:hypothetical protein
MIIGFLPLAVLIVLIVLGVRKVMARSGGGVTDGHVVRQFFQYLLLFGLLLVAALGLSGLLGRLLERDTLVATDQAELALSVAFTVVGVPLFAGVALWVRRGFAADPAEARSLAWSAYATAATLTGLCLAMFALYGVLAWATGLEPYDGGALARLIVFGAVWGAHWWLGSRLTPIEHAQPHHLLGSLIGLGTAAAGLGVLLTGAFEAVLNLGGSRVLVEGDRPLVRGAVLLAVGAPVWSLYWMRMAARSERNPLWLAYVLLPGVAGGLIIAVVSASTVLYDVLVWLIGQPDAAEASRHFQGTPAGAAATVVGIILWWYHHAVLRETASTARSEVVRVYEYLMAGIGLVAAAVGLTMVLVALVEALTGSSVLVGSAAVNTLIAAATLLVVGGPVWWLFWHRIQAAVARDPAQEHASPTRRIYLFLLFGVAGIAAVVALLVGVYFLVEDILEGVLGTQTLRRVRFPIGVLVSAGAISGYHWTVYRAERALAVAAPVHGPHFVLLVGPRDPHVVEAVAHRTGGRVQAWPRTDQNGDTTPWTADEVMAALGGTTADDVIVLSDAAGLHAIPVVRH